MNSENELLDLTNDKLGRVKSRSITILIFVGLNFLCLLIGFYFSLVGVESIIFSGGAMILLSLTLLVLSIAQQKYYLLIQSLFGLGIVGAIFLFIYLKHLNPRAAQKPVPALILIFGLVYLLPFAWSLIKEMRLSGKKLK